MLSRLAPWAHSLDGEGVVTLGKAFPYPLERVRALVPRHSPDGAGVWSQQGQQDGLAPAVAAFRVYGTPPPRLPLFAFSGAISAGSRSNGLRQQGRAGKHRGQKS